MQNAIAVEDGIGPTSSGIYPAVDRRKGEREKEPLQPRAAEEA
jgi:hypothetical protein